MLLSYPGDIKQSLGFFNSFFGKLQHPGCGSYTSSAIRVEHFHCSHFRAPLVQELSVASCLAASVVSEMQLHRLHGQCSPSSRLALSVLT